MSFLTNKCLYALKAILELSKHEGEGPIAISFIAEKQDIPSRFLEGILRELRQAGIVESARGKEGGYFLSKPAKQLTAGEILRLFDAPFFNGNGNDGCCVVSKLAEQAQEAVSTVFDSAQFNQLAEQAITSETKVLDYSI